MKTHLGDGFSHYDKQYMVRYFCCRTIHCKVAAQIVGVVMGFFLFVQVSNCISRIEMQKSGYITDPSDKEASLFAILYYLVKAIIITVFFIGTCRKRSRMVYPFVIYIFIFLLLVYACAIVFLTMTIFSSVIGEAALHDMRHHGHDFFEQIIMLFKLFEAFYGNFQEQSLSKTTVAPRSNFGKNFDLRLFFLFCFFGSLLLLLILTWSFYIVRQCYDYFNDLEKFRRNQRRSQFEFQTFALP